MLTGRTKELIIRKGENISPREIEDLLQTHPKVARVAVIGLPDRDRGERVCAVVETPAGQEPLTFAEMQQFCRDAQLMTQKIPEQLEVARRAAAQRHVQDPQARAGQAARGQGAQRMKFVFNYPETSGLESDLLDSGEISDVAVAVEAAGFDAFALTEHPIPGANWLAHGGHQTLDPFVGLAFAAAVTERIQLLTHLSVAPYRNPFLFAKTAATLDRCSKGRFILGLGTGYHKTEFFASAASTSTSATRCSTRRSSCCRRRGRASRSTPAGMHFTAKGVIQRPRSGAGPDPDLDRRQLQARRRRAATVQGWMPMGIPEEVARTTRSPHISGLEQLAGMIAEVKDLAGDRAGELDFCMSYMERGHPQPTKDMQRHIDRARQPWRPPASTG